MTILTAELAQVKVGHIEIEGLRDSKGEYYIGVPQLNEWISFSTHQNYASQELRRILGEDFSPHKLKTTIYRQLINGVKLVEVEKVLFRLALKGNQKAISVSESLIGLSLTQLFADAFKDKFDAEDRQQFLRDRQATKNGYHILKNEVDLYKARHPELSEKRSKWMMFNCMDDINRRLLGVRSYSIKEQLGLDPDQDWNMIRDYLASEVLKRIDRVQELAAAKIRTKDMMPTDAVSEALNDFGYLIYSRYLNPEGQELARVRAVGTSEFVDMIRSKKL